MKPPPLRALGFPVFMNLRFALLACLVVSFARAAAPERITLFNGRDLTGWRFFLADNKSEPSAAPQAMRRIIPAV